MNLKALEDNAEHLFKLVKHMVQVETNMNGVAHHITQELHDILEAHVNPPVAAVVAGPTPVPAPVVEASIVAETPAPAPVVDEPVTLANIQSAANKAN